MSGTRLHHPVRIAVVAASALAASAALALQRPVPAAELDLTTALNDLPDAVAWSLFPIMQLGTALAPLVVGLVIDRATHERRLAVAAVAAGWASWLAAKVLKEIVGRGRPLRYLPEVDVRDGAGTGLGYPSGHASVAAALALVAVAAVPRRWRSVPVVLVALVGVARVVHGVHLPGDVVGGWALGTLVGLAAVEGAERSAPDHPG